MAFLSEARVVWLVHVAPLLGAMLMMANSGSIYLFPVVSSALGARLGFSEAELSTISTLVNAGTWLSVLPGLALDRLQRLYIVEVARRRVVRYDPVWV